MELTCTNVPGLSNAWLEAANYLDEVYEAEYKGWRTTTQLTAPVRSVLLNQRHDAELSEDVTRRAAPILGTALHMLLETAGKHYGHTFCDERFTIEILGKEIGVKPDRVDPIPNTEPLEYTLIDFKSAKTWSVMLGEKDEWINQLIINAYALRTIGLNVTRMRDEATFKDWSDTELERKKQQDRNTKYPAFSLGIVAVDYPGDEEALQYLTERVQLFIDCESLADDDLPECTNEERWMRDECFKVWKTGTTKKASIATVKNAEGTRVSMTTRNMAVAAMQEKGYTEPEYEIRYHVGTCTRCEKYCTANRFCSQWKKSQEGEF